VFDREIVTLTDRKEKKKHQCFVEDPTTHTFKAIGFISRKLHPQQTLTQSIQEKVITSFRNTEGSSHKYSPIDSLIHSFCEILFTRC
jgi:hypothetical protein